MSIQAASSGIKACSETHVGVYVVMREMRISRNAGPTGRQVTYMLVVSASWRKSERPRSCTQTTFDILLRQQCSLSRRLRFSFFFAIDPRPCTRDPFSFSCSCSCAPSTLALLGPHVVTELAFVFCRAFLRRERHVLHMIHAARRGTACVVIYVRAGGCGVVFCVVLLAVRSG